MIGGSEKLSEGSYSIFSRSSNDRRRVFDDDDDDHDDNDIAFFFRLLLVQRLNKVKPAEYSKGNKNMKRGEGGKVRIKKKTK